MAFDTQTLITEARGYVGYGTDLAEGVELALLARVQPLNPAVVNWATRVQNNGGSPPSAKTQQALSTFFNALDAQGLTPKMEAMLVCVPDSLTAAITPLIKGTGLDPWTNNNFVAADLNVYGLKGNGTSKYLQTGITPSTSSLLVTSSGLTVFSFSPSGLADTDIGCSDASNAFQLSVSLSDSLFADCWNTGTQRITGSNPYWYGYTSMNRVANNDFRVYVANGQTAHGQFGATNAVTGGALPTLPMAAFATNGNGPILSFSHKRIRAFAVHKGFSATDSSNFYNALVALDSALIAVAGNHAIVTDWLSRVSTNGGAAPSAATISALNTFCSTLDSKDLMRLVCIMNCLVPDNLTAARTPLVVDPGNTTDPFTNSNFVAGDLTVNGLIGDGATKKLDSGFNASKVFTGTNGGATLYNSTSSNGTEQDMGTNTGTMFQFHISYNLAGTGNAICDDFNDTGSRILTPNHLWTGYTTMQRTTNAIYKLYKANSVTAHAQLGATNVTVNGSAPPNLTTFLFCMNNGGAGSTFSTKRLSFMAIHFGMSTTQSQDWFNAIQALRTNLGGGFI